jgi:hypothetical protein
MAGRRCLHKHMNRSLQGMDKGCFKNIDCFKDMDKDRLPEADLQAILVQHRLTRLPSLATVMHRRLNGQKASRFKTSILSTQFGSCHGQEFDRESPSNSRFCKAAMILIIRFEKYQDQIICYSR